MSLKYSRIYPVSGIRHLVSKISINIKRGIPEMLYNALQFQIDPVRPAEAIL